MNPSIKIDTLHRGSNMSARFIELIKGVEENR